MKAMSLPFQVIIIIIVLLLLVVVVSVFVTQGVSSGQKDMNTTKNLEQLCAVYRAMGCGSSYPSGLDKACYNAGIDASGSDGVSTACENYCCSQTTS